MEKQKQKEDLRIRGTTPEALAKSLFGGAEQRPDTKPKPRRAAKSLRAATP